MTVKISDQVKSSSGKSVSRDELTAEAQSNVFMTIGNVVHVKQGDSIDLPYTVSGVQNAVVSVNIENPDLVELVNVSDDAITVTGKVYGSTRIRVVLENTGIEKLIDIKVDTYSAIETKDTTEGGELKPPTEEPPTKPQPPTEEPPTKPQPPTEEPPTKPQPPNTVVSDRNISNGTIADTSLGRYRVINATKKTAKLVSVNNKKSMKLNVPNTVNINGITCKVVEVGANIMKGNTKLMKVILGNNVTTIGKQAFSGCKKLKTITIKSKVLKKVGKKAFKGIHAKAKIKVPKAKLGKYKRILKGKGQAKSVKIKA